MGKFGKIMEVFWLVVIFVSLGYVMYFYYINGFSGNEQLLVIPGIAIFWYYTRTKLRKRIEKNMHQDK